MSSSPADPDAGPDVMPGHLRFLEIGGDLLFARAYPAQTDAFYAGTRHHRAWGAAVTTLGPTAYFELRRRLRRGVYDLVIAHVPLYAPWHPRSFLSMWKYRQASYPAGLFSQFACRRLAATEQRTPVVAVDLLDSFTIGRHNFPLLDRGRAYFKRELPADNWLVFHGTGHRNLPTARFRHSRLFQRRLEAIRPLSYGVFPEITRLAEQLPPVPKTTDVFFAGTIAATSTVRSRGLAQLLALRARGVTVDVPDRPVPRAEFLARCAAAHLVWSPAGFGWDCGRHYEAALCGTVPLMNLPTIERYAPLEDGVHAVYYAIEGDGLARAVLGALADRPRLAAMGAAARAHVLAHHTHEALCRHIVRTALAPEALPPPAA